MTLLPLWDGNGAFGVALEFCLAQRGSSEAQGATCPRGELRPHRWQVPSCLSLFSPQFRPQERLPRPARCPQARQVPGVLPSFLPSMEVWWGVCMCLT